MGIYDELDSQDELEGLISALLGSAHSFTQEQVDAAALCAYMEVLAYTRRETLDAQLIAATAQIAVIKLNMIGSEGASSIAYSGETESYIDGYPANIRSVLNNKRLIKAL